MNDAGHDNKLSRRMVLKGLGGAALTLPFLDSLLGPRAQGQDPVHPPFAIFLRQANGVAQAHDNGEIGSEPERFWPRTPGALTRDNATGRALEVLSPYFGQLLAVGGINGEYFDYGDGHARGALQGLTARGPVVEGAGGDSEAAGESIDHRIGRELNSEGQDSLFLYAGHNGGWLGGACISYRSAGVRRAPLHDPWQAYQQLVGGEAGLDPEAADLIASRRKSVNDLVRGQLQRIAGHPRLGSEDRRRVDLHLQAVRDLELAVTCRLQEDRERELESRSPGYDSNDGADIIRTVELHMDVTALAVSCGYTRSVAIQVGNGNDGSSRYRDPDTGERMENYHYISHRRLSHDASGDIISGSDVLHHKIDRQFAGMFAHLLDRLSTYTAADGSDLLQHGVAAWYNDNSDGPPHGMQNIPWILAGSANGFLRQGRYVVVDGGGPTHARMLNTIGTAVGLRNEAGDALDDFGDPGLPGGTLSELIA
ncbi:MAG: DUF1552 domain-containing protein [Myxococcota bacterium]